MFYDGITLRPCANRKRGTFLVRNTAPNIIDIRGERPLVAALRSRRPIPYFEEDEKSERVCMCTRRVGIFGYTEVCGPFVALPV